MKQSKDLTDYIKVFDNVIPETECVDIIKKFTESKSKEQVSSEYYKFTQIILHNDSEWAHLEEPISKKINEYVEKFFLETQTFLIPEISGYERMRIKHYPEQGGHDLHCDVVNHLSAKRFCSCFIFLSDGGIIDFPTLKHEIKTKVGSIVMFPSSWMMPYFIKPEFFCIETYLHYK